MYGKVQKFAPGMRVLHSSKGLSTIHSLVNMNSGGQGAKVRYDGAPELAKGAVRLCLLRVVSTPSSASAKQPPASVADSLQADSVAAGRLAAGSLAAD